MEGPNVCPLNLAVPQDMNPSNLASKGSSSLVLDESMTREPTLKYM